jgi:hypothetical protein
MAGVLQARRFAVLVTGGPERVELAGPREAVLGEGAGVEIVVLAAGRFLATNSDLKPADRFATDTPAATASPEDYDALNMPGAATSKTAEVRRLGAVAWGTRARKEFPQRPAPPMTAEQRHELLTQA